jgi:hypothetical protein
LQAYVPLHFRSGHRALALPLLPSHTVYASDSQLQMVNRWKPA